jgi:NADH dehydrogenase
VRPGARGRDREFLTSIGAETVEASLETAAPDLTSALQGCDVAVHLIGSIAPPKGETLENLHGTQTANLVKAARIAGVKKLVQVTALGTSENALSSYHRTKWLAEEHIRNSGIPFVILRPSLIIGRRVGNRDSKLVMRYFDLIRTRPRVPLIGGGTNKIQPIYVEDLVAAIVKSVLDDRYDNQTLELGGSEVMPMKEFVEKLIRLENSPKKVAPVPPVIAGVMAAACEAFQNVPLISKDQIKLSSQDNITTNNALQTVFGITPVAVDSALQTYKRQSDLVGSAN